MRALWLEGSNLTLREDLPVPELVGGEALVKVIVAGICSTDLELARGYYPFSGIPGHEFVSRVERGPRHLQGKRVVGEINASCGSCESCLGGHGNHCPTRSVLGIVGRNGAFSEYLALPTENLYPVADDIATDIAVFTEPLAAALHIQEQVVITPSTRVLVVGAGKLGQLIARSVSLTGCKLVAVGRDPRKIAMLAEAGIHTMAATDLQQASIDVAIECTGSSEGIGVARRALRPQGTLVLKSTYAGEARIDMSSVVVDEIHIVGSRCGAFAPALKLLQGGDLDVASLISERYGLSQAVHAFERAAADTVKVLIDVD